MILLFLKGEWNSSVVQWLGLLSSHCQGPGFDLVGQINKYREVIFLKGRKGIVRGWNLRIHTIFNMDNQQQRSTIWHRALCSVLHVGSLDGSGLGEE